jgi:hypothetical protein
MGTHEKTDVSEAEELSAKTPQPGADPDDAEQIAVEREERLDPDNRPEGAEVNNSERTFDAEKGLFTDSEGYDEAEKRFPPSGAQGA